MMKKALSFLVVLIATVSIGAGFCFADFIILYPDEDQNATRVVESTLNNRYIELHEKKKTIVAKLSDLYNTFGKQLSEAQQFELFCLRRSVNRKSTLYAEWDAFKEAVDACNSLADVEALLQSNYIGFTGVYETNKQREEIAKIADDILKDIGYYYLPNRAYFPDYPELLLDELELEPTRIYTWSIYAGFDSNPAYAVPFLTINLSPENKVNSIVGLNVTNELEKGDMLNDSEKELILEIAINFLEKYGPMAISGKSIQVSEYSYLGMPDGPCGEIWLHTYDAVNEENYPRGFNLLINLQSKRIHTFSIFSSGLSLE